MNLSIITLLVDILRNGNFILYFEIKNFLRDIFYFLKSLLYTWFLCLFSLLSALLGTLSFGQVFYLLFLHFPKQMQIFYLITLSFSSVLQLWIPIAILKGTLFFVWCCLWRINYCLCSRKHYSSITNAQDLCNWCWMEI